MEKVYKYFRAISLLVVIAFSCISQSVYANDIKLGVASVEIKMHGEVPPADLLICSIAWNELFGRPIEMQDRDIADSGNGTYRFDLPSETTKTTAVVKISDIIGNAYALGFIDLIQGDTLTLDCTFANGNLTVVPSNKNGFNAYPMDIDKQRNMAAYVNSEFFNLVSYTPDNPVIIHGITDPQKVYAAGDTAWREVLRQQDDVYLPIINHQRAAEVLHGDELRTYLNNLSCFIYGMEHLRYDKQRSWWAPEGNRGLPPLEYYDFLNRIDFSQLTDFVPYYSPYHILKNILLYFPVEIEPIGDAPVGQWQAQAREKLEKVLTDVPDSMLRLLSTASYRMQLDDNKPFTPAQIKNISEAYTTDDLGLILLNANNKLEAQLKERLNVHDLTAEKSFNLKNFIDANYPGRPVVVDFWNTWCGPCLRAHKDTEAIKALPEAQDVVFLYVSDTSSELEAFNKLAPQIGGEHLRLSLEAADGFLESEGFISIPSYFFFDSKHNLIHKQTAFPGQEKYKHLLQQIN